MSVIIRWTDDEYNVYEDLVGLHQADKVDADSIVKMIKNVLLTLGLDIMNMRFVHSVQFFNKICNYGLSELRKSPYLL